MIGKDIFCSNMAIFVLGSAHTGLSKHYNTVSKTTIETTRMYHVYLDWNVFDKIEKKWDKVFIGIEKLIVTKEILTPYSNAHINDLVRGYEKNPSFINNHLSTLSRLTHNLCITQYWGQKNTTWHYRDVNEFFQSALEEIETSSKSFSQLLVGYGVDDLWDFQLSSLGSQRLPNEFKQLFQMNPAFNRMFPRAKEEMNALALSEDLYDFVISAKKDFSLYKALRNYVNQSRAKFKQQPKIYREMDKAMAEIPRHLNIDESWKKYTAKNKTSDNPLYQKITDTYFKIDFKGYKSDERFSNLIDDSLHTFYGAHCDYFVTLDDKCHYKASETYKQLNIKTKAVKPLDFIEEMEKVLQ